MNTSGNTFYNGWVFKLIVINVLIYAIQIFTANYQYIYTISGFSGQSSIITFYLGLMPALVMQKGFIWQIFSYMFLHGTTSFMHIFFNMYALLIFGAPIEHTWGSKKFLFYYLYCGVGAGLSILLLNYFSGGLGYSIPTIGASGAVFGLLLAFGILFPNSEILLFFILPVKAKYLVIGYGALELYLELTGGTGNISHIGHLGGLFFGLLYFLIQKKRAINFKSRVKIAKMKKDRSDNNKIIHTRKEKMDEHNNETKKNILIKLKETGYESLSDDEVQYIKFIDIMKDDKAVMCDEGDLNIDDDYCRNCENFNSCFLREVTKHLEK